MKRLFLTLLLSILALTSFAPQAYAKVWTKELVDKVTLESGYKFSICTIDLAYDRSNNPADNIFDAKEKEFEANPAAFPCNKQSQEDVLFADITLYFNKAKWNDVSAPEKLIEFQNHLYSVDEYGDVLSDPNGNTDIKDIAAFDWFSTIPTIHGIRGTQLINTDPNAAADQKTLSNSNFLIIHDPATGKFTSALFIINNVVYKISNIISQVTVPTTLVDYTGQQGTIAPSPSVQPSNAPISSTPIVQETGWSIYTNNAYHFSFKYPSTLQLNNQDSDKAVFDGVKEKSIPSQLTVNFKSTIDLNSILNCTKITPTNNGNKVLCIDGNPSQQSVGSVIFDEFTLKVNYKGLVNVYRVAQAEGNSKIEFVNDITNSTQILDQILPNFTFTN
jgi:hypothetical protein